MARRLAADTEVRRGRDDPSAEMILPDPVDDHSRRQGMCGISQPICQLEPATALSRNRGGRFGGQETEPRHSARDDLPGWRDRLGAEGDVDRLAFRHGVTARQLGGKRRPLQPCQFPVSRPPGVRYLFGSRLMPGVVSRSRSAIFR